MTILTILKMVFTLTIKGSGSGFGSVAAQSIQKTPAVPHTKVAGTADSSWISDSLPATGLLPVSVTAFQGRGDGVDIAASIHTLDQHTLQLLDNSSLLYAFNTAPGIRLEERSPGSLRLSIRGSLLRSPYGVRGVKFYMDGMPLTDAGGNTYLQSLAVDQLAAAEIIKGPAGSLYGGGTGGVVLLHAPGGFTDSTVHHFNMSYTGGSFGRINPVAGWTRSSQKSYTHLGASYLHSDGNRQQDSLHKTVVQFNGNYQITPTSRLRINSFYSHLQYQTPGAVTQSQWGTDTTAYPLAVQQKAAVYNKTFWTGASLKSALGAKLQNETSLVFSFTDFKNPFTSNYEKRKEINYGGRTVFTWLTTAKRPVFSGQLLAGMEWMAGDYHIDNYGNQAGTPDTLQYKDQLHIQNYTYFIQYQANLYLKWHLQLGLSGNRQHIFYQRVSDPDFGAAERSTTKNQWSPKLGLTYQLADQFALFLSAAKGFSTPTIAEIHPSDGRFEKALQPEGGWNLEGGIKGTLPGTKLVISGSLYRFTLKNAIVRRVDANNTEYYVNAGSTRQAGAELYFKAPLFPEPLPNPHRLIQQIMISGSYSYQPYRFLNYQTGDQNDQGHPLTGVPKNIAVGTLEIILRNGLYLNTLMNATSSIPLNDASTVYADAYQLWQAKLGYRFNLQKVTIDLFGGLDNLLNQRYSLGNDINAYGGRYFNPAPGRNFYAGLSVQL